MPMAKLVKTASYPETVLITGGTGFVGANLVLHMAQSGYQVVAYDLSPPSPLVGRFWDLAKQQIVFEEGSVTDQRRLTEVAATYKPTDIIHAAAVTAVNTTAEASLATRLMEVNLLGTVRVLDLARDSGVRRFLYVSSGGVYGSTDPEVPLSEDSPLQLVSLYAIAKETSERVCLRYRELFEMDVIVGRLGQPYGPMERETNVRSVLSPIYQMARAALQRGLVRLPKPDYQCDWTYTADLAEAIRQLLRASDLGHVVYNLSNGQPRWLSDVAKHLSVLIDGARFEWVDSAGDIDLSSDPRRGPMAPTRLYSDVDFQPAYTLERGLEAALPWWREMVQAKPK